MPHALATKWLDTIKSHSHDAGDGRWLEQLVCELGPQIPDWDLAQVFQWKDWPTRSKYFPTSSSLDLGIDNVGIRLDGSLVAIQCKARASGATLTSSDLGTFRHTTGDARWSELWVVTNAQFSRELGESNQRAESRPLKLIDFIEPVRELAREESGAVKEDDQLSSMQDKVVRRVVKGLQEHAKKGRQEWNDDEARGHIVLPCGTGKTRIAYRVMIETLNDGDIAVILVPSIALVSQLKKEFQKLARRDSVEIRTLAVCSDSTAGGGTFKGRRKKTEDLINLSKDRSIDTSYVHSYEVVGDTATNKEKVTEWLKRHKSSSSNALKVIFSTYQSAHNTAFGLCELDLKAKLMVCDEAHRTAGIKKIPKDGEHLRNFTLCHDKDAFPATFRLYQTATPRIYTDKKNQKLLYEDDSKWDVRSMNDVTTFGPELFRLSYVEAVERKLLSDYRIIAWGISESEAVEAQEIATKLNTIAKESGDTSNHWDTAKAMRVLSLAAFVAGCVPDAKIKSVIAFCNRIKISRELAMAIVQEPVQKWLKGYFERCSIQKLPVNFDITHIDASHHSAQRNNALYRLGSATAAQPFCITNVGIFGEGTDSPNLTAVAFMNPRKSPVDVIQAVGRAMRKSKDKELGYILVPVFIPKDRDPESFLRDSDPKHGWEELGQILQALRAHDGRIEDHLESLMDLYLPSEPTEPKDHLIVVKEPHRHTRIFVLNTKTPAVEKVIAPRSDEDQTSIVERLKQGSGNLKEIKDVSALHGTTPPKSISTVSVREDHIPYIKDLTYTIQSDNKSFKTQYTWDPEETIKQAKKFLFRDRQRKKPTSRPVKPRPSGTKPDLGLKVIHLAGETLADTGIQLNLLEKSGIQSGPKRDTNLLKGTVNKVADYLRSENLEETLSSRLGMEKVAQSSDAADACIVTGIIWINAAIMHARLSKSTSRRLRAIRPLNEAIGNVEPAQKLMDAWNDILITDYVPIFKLALQLLQDVAFKNLECVADALRLIAKDASEIADRYADLGMDHAGELFNAVMGNQRSDGAFFTQPLAATMLAELCLHASRKSNWLDEQSWDELRTFDPACGSGTILVAMLNAIKRRIRMAGGTQETISTFHRRAVEHLLIGADINHVALQLAACQLTLGDVDASYNKMNLHLMDYGVEESDRESDAVKTGTVELLLDERIVPRPSQLADLHNETVNQRLDMSVEAELTALGDEVHEVPPSFTLMNPPYTSWRDIGSKFNANIQSDLRDRLREIWDDVGSFEPLLLTKKTSIATLFELLAMKLTLKSKGVMGFVRPAIVLTAEDSRGFRQLLAAAAHVDYVLTCHHPKNFNMSWDTNINECLIVMSNVEANKDLPTRFINLHRFPESLDDAHEIIERAVAKKPFDGSSIKWDYDLVRQGNWAPAIYSDCRLAELARGAISTSRHLRSDLIGSRRKSSGGGGYPWRVGRFDI